MSARVLALTLVLTTACAWAAPGTKATKATDLSPLLDALEDPSDWCKVLVAVETLGRQRSLNAAVSLERVARDHWFPPVRAAANNALAVLRGKDRHAGDAAQVCERLPVVARTEAPVLTHGLGELVGDQLKAHPYRLDAAAIDHAGEPSGHVATTGITVSGGFLLGSVHADRSGELVFTDEVAAPKLILQEHTFALHRLGDRIVAVTGRDGGGSRAALYRIQRRDDGLYEAEWWRRLPGPPLRSGFLRDGSLLIECRHGDLLLARDGTMRTVLGPPDTRPLAALIDELKASREPTPELIEALVRAGEPAAAKLAELFVDDHGPGWPLFISTCRIFARMEEHAAPAVEALSARVAASHDYSVNRRWAIRALGCMGEHATPAMPALIAARAQFVEALSPTIDPVVNQILRPSMKPPWLTELGAHPGLARDLGAAGATARDAGPALVSLMKHDDPSVRLMAMRELGYLDFRGATAELLAKLQEPDDWRIVAAAAESLGRIRSVVATAPLQRLAADHWYPRVRAAAGKALRVLRGGDRYVSPWEKGFFEQAREEARPWWTASTRPLPTLLRSEGELDRAQLAKLGYQLPIEPDRHDSSSRLRAPGCGVRLDEGFLVGADGGEWGGELVYLEGVNLPNFLLLKNTHAIHRLGERIVATTGLAHMDDNEGALYVIDRDGDGNLRATRWKALPGAPRQSGLLADGSLFVRCVGGDVEIDEDGEMRMYEPKKK